MDFGAKIPDPNRKLERVQSQAESLEHEIADKGGPRGSTSLFTSAAWISKKGPRGKQVPRLH